MQQASPPTIEGFRDLAFVGRGGFSTVYSATQEGIERRVAIKVLDVGMSDHDRFLRECRTLGALSEIDGIVGVLHATFTSAGQPCIVMQLMGGGSLGQVLRENGPLPVHRVVETAVRLCDALQLAHDQRVFHRDIKPENVLFSSRGNAAIADFGIAMVDGVEARSQTIESISPPHAPPERFSDAPSDPIRGDVYSLASTVYTALAGTPPFGTAADGGLAGLITRITTWPVPPLTGPAIDPAFVSILSRAMSKDPSLRHSSMGELRYDIASVLDQRTALRRASPTVGANAGHPHAIEPVPAHSSTVHRPPTGPSTWSTPTPVEALHTDIPTVPPEPSSRARGLWIAAGALLVSVLAAGGTLLGLHLAEDETTATARPELTDSRGTVPRDPPRSPTRNTVTTPVPTTPATTSAPPETVANTPPTSAPAPTTTTALPTSEATTAVDRYLEAASSMNMEYFLERWEYPISLYYSESRRNVSEETVRDAAVKYWEKFTHLSFARNGPTVVTASSRGWDTTTEYVAELDHTDGRRECLVNTINLSFTFDWKVHSVTESPGSTC